MIDKTGDDAGFEKQIIWSMITWRDRSHTMPRLTSEERVESATEFAAECLLEGPCLNM